MFAVEQGVAIPARRRVGAKAVWHKKYPFSQMAAGDSFLMPFETDVSPNNLQCRVYAAAKVWGVKIKTMTVDDGVRVWRVA